MSYPPKIIEEKYTYLHCIACYNKTAKGDIYFVFCSHEVVVPFSIQNTKQYSTTPDSSFSTISASFVRTYYSAPHSNNTTYHFHTWLLSLIVSRICSYSRIITFCIFVFLSPFLFSAAVVVVAVVMVVVER